MAVAMTVAAELRDQCMKMHQGGQYQSVMRHVDRELKLPAGHWLKKGLRLQPALLALNEPAQLYKVNEVDNSP